MESSPRNIALQRPVSAPALFTEKASWDLLLQGRQDSNIRTPSSFRPPRTPSLCSQRSTLSLKPQLPVLLEQPLSEYQRSSGDRRQSEALSRNDIVRSHSARSIRTLSSRHRSTHSDQAISPRLRAIQNDSALPKRSMPRAMRPPQRHSSLRIQGRVLDDDDTDVTEPQIVLASTRFEPCFHAETTRPNSHPQWRRTVHAYTMDAVPTLATLNSSNEDDPWALPPLPLPSSYDLSPMSSPMLRPKPRPSFTRLSSLDNLITYREERAEWKRTSSILQDRLSTLQNEVDDTEQVPPVAEGPRASSPIEVAARTGEPSTGTETPLDDMKRSEFRHGSAEIGFALTIATTQFIAEYLISGFAIELPILLERHPILQSSGPSLFWPASLLSLILSAMLLIFARISDMHGGYHPFMFGITWLVIWTIIPGCTASTVLLDVSRAMQGLAIAAWTPSTFTMIGAIYPDGRRKNLVLGVYSGCAPLGFFVGFLTAGALPTNKSQWYFWIATATAFMTWIMAFLTVPREKIARKQLNLKMDWLGAFLITAGLILISYALAVEPYAGMGASHHSGFSHPQVYAPLVAGIICLIVSVYVEGWYADCPLLPLDFFRPKSVMTFCLAGLCFYASYGVWLYVSAQYIQSPTGVTSGGTPLTGISLAVWYTPTAIGGLVLCVIGGAILHIVPIYAILLLSGLAWICAPLLLALAPLPLDYWTFVLPSMICATLGIDLTFTVSIVFISAVQPLKYQGLAGAVCSILVNLAISFSLSISEIVMTTAEKSVNMPTGEAGITASAAAADADHMINHGFQAAFLYAAASAGLGFVICVLFVRISRSVVTARHTDEEEPQAVVHCNDCIIDDIHNEEKGYLVAGQRRRIT